MIEYCWKCLIFLQKRVFLILYLKNRLIRQKNLKIPVLYLSSKPTDSQSGVITITPTEPTVSDTEKLSVTLSHAWLIPVEFT